MFSVLRICMTSLAVVKAKKSIENLIVHAVLMSIAALLVLGSIGFMLSAAWIWIAAQMSPFLASIIVGGGLLILAVCIMAYAVVRRAQARQQQGHRDMRTLVGAGLAGY